MRLVTLSCSLLALSACSMYAASNPPYLVYFQERSATLDTDAKKVIALVSEQAREQPAASVSVSGYTDSAGNAPADLLLSQQRAQSVADALVADGVPADRLVKSGRGQTGENPGLASRRVEIALAAYLPQRARGPGQNLAMAPGVKPATGPEAGANAGAK